MSDSQKNWIPRTLGFIVHWSHSPQIIIRMREFASIIRLVLLSFLIITWNHPSQVLPHINTQKPTQVLFWPAPFFGQNKNIHNNIHNPEMLKKSGQNQHHDIFTKLWSASTSTFDQMPTSTKTISIRAKKMMKCIFISHSLTATTADGQ